METTLAFCLYIFVALSTVQSRQPTGWQGLVPLHSTRADVERLLGPSPEECKCFYETPNEKISIEYSQGPCKGFLHGWNVPAGTVLMITVRPNAEVLLSGLGLDLSKFDKSFGTDTRGLYYTDKDAGIRYGFRENGILESVSYVPKRADYSLRCKNFPSIPDLGHREFKPFDAYSKISSADEQARLDNFSIWLRDQPQMKGYILVYASKDIPTRRALIRARRAKDYLVRRRGMNTNKIAIIDGGYREQFGIELYILPRDVGPPTPYPTVVPGGIEKQTGVRPSILRFWLTQVIAPRLFLKFFQKALPSTMRGESTDAKSITSLVKVYVFKR